MFDVNHVRQHCLAALEELSTALEGIKEDDAMAPHLHLMIERGRFKLHMLNAMLAKAESDDPKKIDRIKGMIQTLKADIIRDMKLTGLILSKNLGETTKAKKKLVLSEADARELGL